MLAFGIGVVLALLTAVTGKLTGFDKDRSFYPTVLVVIASYYLLFAVMGNQAVWQEALWLLVFSAAALIGAFKAPWLVGVGIIAHGVFDFARPLLLSNNGVPLWWPAFCAGVDLVLGLWVLQLSFKASDKGVIGFSPKP